MNGIYLGLRVKYFDRNWIVRVICEDTLGLEDVETGEIASALTTDIQRENPTEDRIEIHPATMGLGTLPPYIAHIREANTKGATERALVDAFTVFEEYAK